MELAAIDNGDDEHGHGHEEERVKEPANGGETKIVAAQAHIEMFSCIRDETTTARGDFVMFIEPLIMKRHRAKVDRGVIILAQRPCIFEEGVDEDVGEEENLQIPHERRCFDGEGDGVENFCGLITISQNGDEAQQDENAGVGEE